MAASPNGSAFRFGAALSVVQNLFGYLINEVESFPTITTGTPTSPFITQNADRLGLVIANTGLNVAYVGLSSLVGSNFGFLLTANGGSISLNIRDDLTLTTRAWWGAAVGASDVLYVLELIGVKPLAVGATPGVV